MSWISLVGLVTLLGIAWLMSYHRRDLPVRILVWGLGLQFLFALIILREDFWSFVGMGVFAALLVAYLLRDREPEAAEAARSAAADGEEAPQAPPAPPSRRLSPALVIQLTLFLGVGAGLTAIPSNWIGFLMAGLLLFLLVNSRWRFAAGAQRYAGALLIVCGTSWLIVSGLYGELIFERISGKVAEFLNLSDYGAAFLFGNLADPQYFFPGEGSAWPGFGFLFAFKVLPTIVFFGGFMAVLYYLGLMQKVIEAVSHFMRWTIGTSGAETLSCSANIFVGQTEAPLLIKPFLDDMTDSELLTIMVGGFATIAGGVLAGYIAMGVPAGHLIAASVMSAPAALVVGKIIFPEKEHSQTAGDVRLPDIEAGGNVIEAASNGITDGLKLAVNVGAMLLGFIALIAVADVLLNWLDSLIDGRLLGGEYIAYATAGMSPAVGEFAGIFPGSLQTFFGTVLRPLAFLMGVPWQDAAQVGNLLGIKLSLNEFVAFGTLGTYIQEGTLGDRGTIIATYALCGFANFSSIGIQIGGIAAIAPNRKKDLARVGLKAMFGGAIASWLTATIAGLLIGG
ncbi:MAG: nucleoside transporter C-terminal domain-containing protein [Acidobacteriota bacterium]|nr:nucleoside transporter C-terminal domain-containing protein [Acidobacteriota bacterium]